MGLGYITMLQRDIRMTARSSAPSVRIEPPT